MPSLFTFCSIASILATIPNVIAGYDSSSASNIAIYWGQNSYGKSSGDFAQQRLSYYCANTELDIIPLAFLYELKDPVLNFASAGDICTAISGSSLFYCSELEEDIPLCQNTYGKTILLSIGGATYSEGGFSSESAAVTAANNIWSIFGPETSSSSSPRPFGSAAVDGFDFDFESTVSNMPAFGNQLRSLMDSNKASTGKQWLLTAAPQCPYPDSADGPMLAGTVFFDIIWIQFYNNYCGVQSYVSGSSTQNNFNYDTWDNWAKTVSLNPDVKLMLGIPGNTGAAGSGYLTIDALTPVIEYCKGFSTFAGVMSWDMSQIWANTGYLDGIVSALSGSSSQPQPSSTAISKTTSAAPTTLSTVTTRVATVLTSSAAAPTTTSGSGSSSGYVAQWGQCGGEGYTGSTVCASPYTCTYSSIWWSQCQ